MLLRTLASFRLEIRSYSKNAVCINLVLDGYMTIISKLFGANIEKVMADSAKN